MKGQDEKKMRGGKAGKFKAPAQKAGQHGPKGKAQGESRKHPGSPKAGGQLFHGSS